MNNGQRTRHREIIIQRGSKLVPICRNFLGNIIVGDIIAGHPVAKRGSTGVGKPALFHHILVDGRARQLRCTTNKILNAAETSCGLMHRGLGILQHAAVMRATQVVTQLHRADLFQQSVDIQDVAQRFGHLLASHGHPVVVHPVTSKTITGSVRLRNLVLVVRELQIQPAAVHIKLRAQVIGGHRRALQVPARAAITPRCGPSRLTRFRGLPQSKIQRVLLARVVGLALLHFFWAVA